ncbi:MAG: hypothetical protein H8D43_03305 [Chloroflexi bacterium]|nr:hypothetical protein [Chloroflexota bacterium]
MGRKAYRTLLMSLVTVLGASLLMAACATVPESAKPDVHLTFDIHENGSNVTTLEVAFHPLIDPFIRRGLDLAQQQLPQGTDPSMLEFQNITREGRKYAAVVARFDSLGDLNAFVNTPQLLSGLLDLIDPGTTIPPLFKDFEAWHDADTPQRGYGVRASLDADTTEALAFMNLAVHVRLPYTAEQHNADKVRGTELIWQAVPGTPLGIEAVGVPRSGVSLPGSGLLGTRPAVWLAIGAAVIVAAVIGSVIIYRRANRPSDEDWGWDED